MKNFLFVLLTILLTGLALPAFADQDDKEEFFSFHVQLTSIYQYKPAFNSPYSSINSLSSKSDPSYTDTNTYFFGVRPFQNTEIFFNPEVTKGVPFGGSLVGVGGFYNGEITRTAGVVPKAYRQRLFLRQTVNFDGDTEKLDADANQHAMVVSKNRFVLTAGNFSVLDILDDNAYAKDPRMQFMNWGNMTYAAYDYAADARGFGWGIFGEWYQDNWVLRFGRMTPPKDPNLLPIDPQFFKHYGDQVEIERSHEFEGRPGKARLLIYRNRQILANYNDATALLGSDCALSPIAGNSTLFCARNREQIKYGIGVNLEQELTDVWGGFLRYMWSDGQTETLAFAEVDRSLSIGAVAKGTQWGRADDRVGIAYLRNELSDARRKYLEAGGMSFFIGDVIGGNGNFHYSAEQIGEMYYSFFFSKHAQLTANYQRIYNPAYNRDRGPVDIYGLRLHLEY
jgi:high affinity Mn2+ porin